MKKYNKADNFRAKTGDSKGQNNPMFGKSRPDRALLNKLKECCFNE